MDKYKKKSLNFMGYSRDMRLTQRENQRSISRHQRFSIIRSLEDESITEEKKESKIPAIGIKKDQAGSRLEMLQKWKQEKVIKKTQESRLKKPTFKVGFIKPDPPPSLSSKPLFAVNISGRLYKSSFQVSDSQTPTKKPEVNIKTGNKDMKIQSTSKIAAPSKPESKLTRNKESGIQFLNAKPKVDTKSKVMNEVQSCSIKKQPIIAKLPLETKKAESRLQTFNTKAKAVPLVKVTRSNIPSFGLPKATASRTLSTEPKQILSSGLPKKATASRTLSTEPKQAIPKKNSTVKSIAKFSKIATSQPQGNICEKASRFESVVPESDSLTNKPIKATFECQLSRIEPVKDQRKSFAPPGFKFQPLIELDSSLFLEDGPSAIFQRMKSQFLRTSTPKQSPTSQKSIYEDEDTKCLEKEDIKCEMDENTQNQNKEQTDDAQHTKNAGNKLGSSHKYDLEAILSSSQESVNLNDVKPMDCKQSLKFPEVLSTQNQEETLLPSEITHSELTLAFEPTPGGAINPPIQLNSVEIHKTEINCADTNPTDDNKITISLSEGDPVLSEAVFDANCIVKPIDCKQSLKFDFSEIASTQNQENVLLSSSITDSADPESDSTISVFLPEVDTVVSESIPVPTCNEPNENAENCLLKIPERKIRNFRQSEKPGLSSISESLENTPKSALKKKILDSVFTPRRSLRLAKLSGNFRSLENLQDTPEPREKKDEASLKVCFTPRRSARLSKFSFNSVENLFDVKRPTLYGSPEDEAVKKSYSRVTYDFDRLSLETEEETRPRNTRGGKVSLLYTPPNKSRPSIMRRSIKGDLMYFSPNS